ncbi:hypothetical protein EV586_102325 [Tumebacillus sp. BK434]|uniref:hypothetical protein n=1 Tax=Tumebacillus sp. BK434 TaxID=2512169 RepID=UPI00104C4D01|nr:hypothetical protein [Tumebacillus sp. BK434]TCP57878.1 hypothetical protein EV586_102325 [Tumebacillus sp. BK434]
MKSYKNMSFGSGSQGGRQLFATITTALLDGGVRGPVGRVDAKVFLVRGGSFHAPDIAGAECMMGFSTVNQISEDEDCEWNTSFGEYLYEAMTAMSIYPRHIAEETELCREYVDRILEDEILPWELSSNFILYLNQRLNLYPEKTKRIIAEHDIDQDLVEKLHYSPAELETLDDIDPTYRKVRLEEFLQQEEVRRMNFLRLI